MNDISTKRDFRMDNAKGFLIILVVVGHFLLPLYRTRFVENTIISIYFFHMPFFVFVSGYFAKSIVKNGKFEWKKVWNILWLYIVYEVIVYFTEGLLEGHFGIPNPFRESGAPWYLLALAIWYASLFFLKKVKTLWAPITLMIFVIIIKYVFHPGDILALDRVLSFSPFFILGYIMNEENLCKYIRSKLSITLSIIAVLVLIFIFMSTTDLLSRHTLVVYGADFNRYPYDYQKYLWISNITWYIGASIVIFGLLRLISNKELPLITKLGRNTLQIYILHRPIRDLLQYAGFYELINPHKKLQVIMIMIFAVLLTVLLGNDRLKKVFRKIQIK